MQLLLLTWVEDAQLECEVLSLAKLRIELEVNEKRAFIWRRNTGADKMQPSGTPSLVGEGRHTVLNPLDMTTREEATN